MGSEPINPTTSVAKLTFRRATLRDLPAVAEVLTDAAQWAKSNGAERWWPVPFPKKWIRPGILRREVVVLTTDQVLVGTFTLRRDDPVMWGVQPPTAAYVHRLAIRRQFAGQGLGRRMLNWAAAEARIWGRTSIRLDCLSTNKGLVRYYRNQGFRPVRIVAGNIPGEDRPSVLMERSLGPV